MGPSPFAWRPQGSPTSKPILAAMIRLLTSLAPIWAMSTSTTHKIVEQITAAARSVLDAGAFLIAMGGDHFVSYPLLKAHARRFGPLALVHFDAHTDTWSSPNGINEPVELNDGTMFSRAVDEGLIVPERSVQIGIRTWVDDPLGITIIDNEAACETSPRSLVIAAITRDHPVYITVDIDCLDPAYAPGTGTPVTGGLTPLRLLQILRNLHMLPICGFDVVEVAPPYDVAGVTALNAATIIYEQLARLALGRGAVQKHYAALSRRSKVPRTVRRRNERTEHRPRWGGTRRRQLRACFRSCQSTPAASFAPLHLATRCENSGERIRSHSCCWP